MHCFKFVENQVSWNWPSGSGKEEFLWLSCIILFLLLSPPGKNGGPSIGQTWIPFIQSWILPTLVEIGLMLLEKKMNIWKVYRSQTNDGQQAIRKAHLSTQLRWAKILWILFKVAALLLCLFIKFGNRIKLLIFIFDLNHHTRFKKMHLYKSYTWCVYWNWYTCI